jgi:hypothetical protein
MDAAPEESGLLDPRERWPVASNWEGLERFQGNLRSGAVLSGHLRLATTVRRPVKFTGHFKRRG